MAVNRTDPEAWRVIDELYPALRRFAAVTAPGDMEPDDLLQEALVHVLRRGALADIDNPGAYIKRTMVNLATSHSRRAGRWRRVMGRIEGSLDTPNTPEYPSDLTELLRLPPRERAALYLAEVEGYRYEEVGRLLGCSAMAARKGASRGRRRLRAALVSTGEPK